LQKFDHSSSKRKNIFLDELPSDRSTFGQESHLEKGKGTKWTFISKKLEIYNRLLIVWRCISGNISSGVESPGDDLSGVESSGDDLSGVEISGKELLEKVVEKKLPRKSF
jgi:hypothetical protein